MNKLQNRNRIRFLKYLLCTIRFNFHYLPWNQAIRLPIVFLTRPNFISLKGEILLRGKAKRGMVLLGIPGNDLFSPRGLFMWDNRGGICEFNGQMGINPDSGIRIYKDAILKFGDQVSFGQKTRIVCSRLIDIGNNVLVSWEVTILDTDMHSFYDIIKNKVSVRSCPIKIGNNVFIGSRCTILKGSFVADYCVVASNTVLNKKHENRFALIAGNPGEDKGNGYTRLVDEEISIEEIKRLREEYIRK